MNSAVSSTKPSTTLAAPVTASVQVESEALARVLQAQALQAQALQAHAPQAPAPQAQAPQASAPPQFDCGSTSAILKFQQTFGVETRSESFLDQQHALTVSLFDQASDKLTHEERLRWAETMFDG